MTRVRAWLVNVSWFDPPSVHEVWSPKRPGPTPLSMQWVSLAIVSGVKLREAGVELFPCSPVCHHPVHRTDMSSNVNMTIWVVRKVGHCVEPRFMRLPTAKSVNTYSICSS